MGGTLPPAFEHASGMCLADLSAKNIRNAMVKTRLLAKRLRAIRDDRAGAWSTDGRPREKWHYALATGRLAAYGHGGAPLPRPLPNAPNAPRGPPRRLARQVSGAEGRDVPGTGWL